MFKYKIIKFEIFGENKIHTNLKHQSQQKMQKSGAYFMFFQLVEII